VIAEESVVGVQPSNQAILIVQDLTYIANAHSESGNLISVTYTGGATAGAEVVSVVGNAISVQISGGASTATQIKAAIDATPAAMALLSVVVSGVGSNTQIVQSILQLAGGLGDLTTVRYTSESFSATPTTTQSKQIRTDRMSSGQIVTSLAVASSMNFELAKETAIDKLMSGAMLNDWDILPAVGVDLTITVTPYIVDGVTYFTNTITRAVGIWATALVVGDILTLSGFTNAVNNTQVQVVEFVSATVIRVVAKSLISEVATVTSAYKRADKLTIGSHKKSFTVEKSFLDLTNKAFVYKGNVCSSMALNVAYGSIVTGSFGFEGTSYAVEDAQANFASYQKTIVPPATTNSFNGSIDMPFISSSALGTLDSVNFCIQSLSLDLKNNYIAENCIGVAAPKDYSPGQAAISVNLSTYLSDINWPVLSKKLSQDPFAIGFVLKNTNGWYGFYMPAVQTSFADPSSAGANQQISLAMKGDAKVGANGESALVIYRS
jgi:hypothetical protein